MNTACPKAPLLRAGDIAWPLDETTCAALMAAHGPLVKSACQRILRDPALAEDAAQEVFVLFTRKGARLPPGTVLGGWFYQTATLVARTHLRTLARRKARETHAVALENLMPPPQTNAWREVEPLLDEAMATLPERQRSLVLLCYFQRVNQREASRTIRCSESVASRELARAMEALRRYLARKGVSVSGPALIALLAANAAQGALGAGALAIMTTAALAKSGISSAFSFTLMTATQKLLATAAALTVLAGVTYVTTTALRPDSTEGAGLLSAPPAAPPLTLASETPRHLAPTPAQRTVPSAPSPSPSSPTPSPFSDAAMAEARGRERHFDERIRAFFLMENTAQAQALLLSEYGIRASIQEIEALRRKGEKWFGYGIMELWAKRQPMDALRWVAGSLRTPSGAYGDTHERIVLEAIKAMPGLNRAMAETQLPEAPGRAALLDLIEAVTAPQSAAKRILAEPDAEMRRARLQELAQGWSDANAIAWAREHLEGADKGAFLSIAGYDFSETNPPAALAVLAELQGTPEFARTFFGMMRGLVQQGRLGAEAAELLANAPSLERNWRDNLLQELGRRWVRSDRAAAIDWVNGLTDPADLRAALPGVVSQLPKEQVGTVVENYLANPNPALELALIAAAAPESLAFSNENARRILDPLIAAQPGRKLRADPAAPERDRLLWRTATAAAQRQAEAGDPAAALAWLNTMPFATPQDHAAAARPALEVWKLKSQPQAAAWVQNSRLSGPLKTELMAAVMK